MPKGLSPSETGVSVGTLKARASLLLLLAVLIVCSQISPTMAAPDVFLKDTQAIGVTTNPGKLMDFVAPTQVDPSSLTTAPGVEYYWYSPPYVGTIPGPKGHSFHLYYTAAAATTVTVTVYLSVQPDGSGTPTLVSSKTHGLEATSTLTHVAIPDVIVIPETTLKGERIKLSISTAAPITMCFDGVTAPSVLNVIPPPDRTAVGGVLMPINRLAVLAPYLILIGVAGAATTAFVIRRRGTDWSNPTET